MKVLYFLSGIGVGIWLEQNYKMPNLEDWVNWTQKFIEDSKKK